MYSLKKKFNLFSEIGFNTVQAEDHLEFLILLASSSQVLGLFISHTWLAGFLSHNFKVCISI